MVCAPVRRDIIDRTGAQTMLYLTCTMISSVDLAHYRVARAKEWISVDGGTRDNTAYFGNKGKKQKGWF